MTHPFPSILQCDKYVVATQFNQSHLVSFYSEKENSDKTRKR